MAFTLLGDLADLVLPVACAGCGAERVRLRFGVCGRCAAELEGLEPFRAAPSPPPPGFPACAAAGVYGGALRGSLLAYKERNAYRLAGPLGALLAASVAVLAPPPAAGPVTLVPVPSTGKAARDRHGDHLTRLAAHAVRRLRAAGWDATVSHLLPSVTETGLNITERCRTGRRG